jgi:hypothetical protein
MSSAVKLLPWLCTTIHLYIIAVFAFYTVSLATKIQAWNA